MGWGEGDTRFFFFFPRFPRKPSVSSPVQWEWPWWKLSNLVPGKPSNKWDLFIVWDDPGGNPREAADRSGRGQFREPHHSGSYQRLFIRPLPPGSGYHSLPQFSCWYQEEKGDPRDRDWMNKGALFWSAARSQARIRVRISGGAQACGSHAPHSGG